MTETTNLKLPLIAGGQAQKHVTHNEALLVLDALTQLAIETRLLNAPPASPIEGQTYIIGNAPTGVWAGKAAQIALFRSSVWLYIVPQKGWIGYLKNENLMVTYNGTLWVAQSSSIETGGRLTLSPTQAIPTSDISTTAATMLYFLPFRGVKISVFADSSATATISVIIPNEGFSLSLAGFAASTNFDIFLDTTGASPQIMAVAWASSGAGTSTRATNIVNVSGLWVSSANNQHLYIGMIRTVEVGQCQDLGGRSAFPNEPTVIARRFVWNVNNQVEREMVSYQPPLISWTYASGAWQRVNANPNCECQFIVGLAERSFYANTKQSMGQATVAAEGVVCIAHNSYTGPSPSSERAAFYPDGNGTLTNALSPLTAVLKALPVVGFNTVCPIERAFTGTIRSAINFSNQSGIAATVMA